MTKLEPHDLDWLHEEHTRLTKTMHDWSLKCSPEHPVCRQRETIRRILDGLVQHAFPTEREEIVTKPAGTITALPNGNTPRIEQDDIDTVQIALEDCESHGDDSGAATWRRVLTVLRHYEQAGYPQDNETTTSQSVWSELAPGSCVSIWPKSDGSWGCTHLNYGVYASGDGPTPEAAIRDALDKARETE